MDICLISVGKINSNWIQEGLSIFESRLNRYVKFYTLIVPDIKNSKGLSHEAQKEEEGRAILKQINNSDYVVLLDERGRDLTSRDFSEWIQRQMNSGIKKLCLIIGGPYGFSKAIYDRSNYKIALSKMTFTHEMAKLLVTEQIYRAFTILRGEPYHHD